jgi:hypothetical protein
MMKYLFPLLLLLSVVALATDVEIGSDGTFSSIPFCGG